MLPFSSINGRAKAFLNRQIKVARSGWSTANTYAVYALPKLFHAHY